MCVRTVDTLNRRVRIMWYLPWTRLKPTFLRRAVVARIKSVKGGKKKTLRLPVDGKSRKRIRCCTSQDRSLFNVTLQYGCSGGSRESRTHIIRSMMLYAYLYGVRFKSVSRAYTLTTYYVLNSETRASTKTQKLIKSISQWWEVNKGEMYNLFLAHVCPAQTKLSKRHVFLCISRI